MNIVKSNHLIAVTPHSSMGNRTERGVGEEKILERIP